LVDVFARVSGGLATLVVVAQLSGCSGGEGETATGEDSASSESGDSDDGTATSADLILPEYLEQTWGIVMSDFSGEFDVEPDGTQILFDEAPSAKNK
jgi:hypothetical protein